MERLGNGPNRSHNSHRPHRCRRSWWLDFAASARCAAVRSSSTLFGDSILPRGGTIALGSLIELAAPFGLNERLVRTATTRLAHDGWLEGRRAGKLSEYHLSKNGRARFAEATKRIYSEPDASGRAAGH